MSRIHFLCTDSIKRLLMYYRVCLEMARNLFTVMLWILFFILLNRRALSGAYADYKQYTKLFQKNEMYSIIYKLSEAFFELHDRKLKLNRLSGCLMCVCKSNSQPKGPGTKGSMLSVVDFLRNSSPHLQEFRRKPQKTQTG